MSQTPRNKMADFFKENKGDGTKSDNAVKESSFQDKTQKDNGGSHKKVAFFVDVPKKETIDNNKNITNITVTKKENTETTNIPIRHNIVQIKTKTSGKMSDFFNENTKKIPIKPAHIHTHAIHNSKSTPKTNKSHQKIINPSFEKERTYFIHSENESIEGRLSLLDYVIYFFPSEEYFKNLPFIKEYFMIPLFSITKIEANRERSEITIKTKDRRLMTFYTGISNFYEIISQYAFPYDPQFYRFPALRYYELSHKEYKTDGWSLYDITLECQRMALPEHFRVSTLNEDFSLCTTYPKYLIVPKKMDDSYLKQLTEYRSKNRFPVITYYYKYSKSSLLRCSQSVSSGKARGLLLEKQYFNMICDNDKSKSFVIYDARPLLNAKANAFKGGCLEKESDYDCCDDIIYCDIENIHAVRKSYKEVMRVVRELSEDKQKHFYTDVDQSLWLHHISSILKGSYHAVNTLIHGRNVVIHCSDGWDRTSQMCALVQVMVDYYYRTVEGFCVLVEKDFVRFGHMFMKRNGNCDNENEFSPVFIQFLDCVYQLMVQFPSAFEFRQEMLVFLTSEVFSCKYGTFMFNCERELEHFEGKEKMVSIWSEVLMRKRIWYNPMYVVRKNPLLPECEICDMVLWKGLFFKYVIKESDKESTLSANKHFAFVQDMVKVIKENGLYEKLMKDTKNCIMDIFG